MSPVVASSAGPRSCKLKHWNKIVKIMPHPDCVLLSTFCDACGECLGTVGYSSSNPELIGTMILEKLEEELGIKLTKEAS